MFQKDFLALDLPEPERRKSNGQTSLIWGGSTSLGCNAIQMAMAAGYEVVTRASEKKFELVRSLGATTVLHNHSTGIVAELIDALKEKKSVGALAITFASAEPCVEVISMADEGNFVAAALPVPELKDTEAEAKMIWGMTLEENEVGPAIFEYYLPTALEKGIFIAEPRATGNGIGITVEGVGCDGCRRLCYETGCEVDLVYLILLWIIGYSLTAMKIVIKMRQNRCAFVAKPQRY
jgi:threonine dehydrogenase-like Zn-dependent dehydrogenase